MRTILIATGTLLAALSGAAAAQGEAPAAPAPACYIEIQKLMAEPPTGIGELGAAIRNLDLALRPQVEEINVLKAQIARIERQAAAAAAASPAGGIEQVSLGIEQPSTTLAPPLVEDRGAEEIQRLQTELAVKQDKLKLDYAARQQEFVGPVQARVSRGAQAFAATSGCSEVKMARGPDLAALGAAGARDVTGAFVAWYIANPPG